MSRLRRVNLKPVILPVPFGNDMFHPGLDRRSAMERFVVERPVGFDVIPDQHHSGLRPDSDADVRKFCGSTIFGLVQENHRGPASLAALLCLGVPIFLAGVEKIVMRLEFLADMVALALHRFGKTIVDAKHIAHPRLDSAHERIPAAQMATVARPEPCLLGAFVQRRWHCLSVDLVDQTFAVAKA